MRAKIVFVYGGSNSGKSAYAEDLAMQYASKVYLATMDSSASYNQTTIGRHREMRKDKGFVTVECPYDLEQAVSEIEEQAGTQDRGLVVLLEDLSNLLSNQCFQAEKKTATEYDLLQHNMDAIEKLAKRCETLIIVGNTINEDGAEYDEMTLAYMRLLERQQAMVAALADTVIEVVASVPCRMK